ncbi:MAG: amino acid permease [Clostridiales Family XIII bacterium]|jgi:lysine-specific permease|nr:amino acid permease [Clostridiales Family XIII bacterium]
MNKEGTSRLHRGIGQRQLSMIAIGGAIGTGLFLASGSAIHDAGPGGALWAYGRMGMVVYFMMTSLGEMATQLHIPGGFQAFASRFIDPALGAAFGWNYWFSWAITLAAEFVAAAIIMQYWFPGLPGSLWAAIFFVFLMVLNLLSAKAFSEAEFWFAGIKVIAVLVFLFVGVLLILGVAGDHKVGFGNWVIESGGARAPFVGGFGAILGVFLVAGFSFQGTEGVGLAAAEARNPGKSIPKAIRSVFWRILIFYIGAIFVIGTLVPFTDPNLLGGSVEDVSMSPFTIVFMNAGFKSAATIVNAIILTAVLSCGNSSLYMASRMIYAMSLNRQAPKFFEKVNRRGVPYLAVWATGAVGALACLTTFIGVDRIYEIFYNASGQTGFIIWLGIAMAHYRFRRAWTAQGRTLNELKYRSKFYPVGPILAMALSLLVIFGANYFVFPDFNWPDLFIYYGFFPAFMAIYLGFKFVHKTKVVPLSECDFEMPKEDPSDAT